MAARPALVRYLALPVETAVLTDAAGQMNVLHGQVWKPVEEGSYMAAVFERGKSGAFELDAEILALLDEEKRDEAIAVTMGRFTSIWPVVTGKVDAILAKKRPPVAEQAAWSAPPELDDELRALLQRGEKIEAIRRYKETTAVGLLEARLHVEGLQASPVSKSPR
jgi:ribosomal protein L7/L12